MGASRGPIWVVTAGLENLSGWASGLLCDGTCLLSLVDQLSNLKAEVSSNFSATPLKRTKVVSPPLSFTLMCILYLYLVKILVFVSKLICGRLFSVSIPNQREITLLHALMVCVHTIRQFYFVVA